MGQEQTPFVAQTDGAILAVSGVAPSTVYIFIGGLKEGEMHNVNKQAIISDVAASQAEEDASVGVIVGHRDADVHFVTELKAGDQFPKVDVPGSGRSTIRCPDPNCGGLEPDDSNYCSFCGMPLKK